MRTSHGLLRRKHRRDGHARRVVGHDAMGYPGVVRRAAAVGVVGPGAIVHGSPGAHITTRDLESQKAAIARGLIPPATQPMLELAVNLTARVIEGVAALLIAGSVAMGLIELSAALVRRGLGERTTDVRLRLAERLVLSIEFLIAADILKTIVTPTLEGIGLVAGVILIRTVLSLSIAYELRRVDRPPPAQRPDTPAGPRAAAACPADANLKGG